MSFLTHPILEILSYFTSFFDKSIYFLLNEKKIKKKMEILNLLSNVLERNLFYFENLIFSKIKFRFCQNFKQYL